MPRALFVCTGNVLAAGALRGWLDSGNEVAEIWTDPGSDLRRSQRTLSTWAPNWSVRRLAEARGIPTRTMPMHWRKWAGVPEVIDGLRANVLITCVTMQIVPPSILALFPGRAFNIHPALLPNYRGPSPYLGTILDDRDDCAGVTVHELAEGIDTGPIIAAEPVSYFACGRDYRAWLARHAHVARRLVHAALPAFLAGDLRSQPQDEGSYRRVGDEQRIGLHMRAADARRTAALIGHTGRLGLAGQPRVRLRALRDELGPPTGAAARVGRFSVEVDVFDRRLRFARWTALDDGVARLDLVRALRRLEQAES